MTDLQPKGGVELNGPGYKVNGDALRWWRVKNHLTQRDVAEITGIAYSTLSRLENGHRPAPRYGTLRKLAKLYGCELDDLIIVDALA